MDSFTGASLAVSDNGAYGYVAIGGGTFGHPVEDALRACEQEISKVEMVFHGNDKKIVFPLGRRVSSQGGQRCVTVDTNRNSCWDALDHDGQRGQEWDRAWRQYCAATGNTAFVASRTGSFVAWHSGSESREQAVLAAMARCGNMSSGEEACAPFDVNGAKCTPAPGAHDLRAKLPACLQAEPDWCWATGVAEIADFFGYHGPRSNVSESSFRDPTAYSHTHCGGLVCQIVGAVHAPNDPGKCCRHRDACGADTGTLWNAANTITTFSGKSYMPYTGFPSAAMLDTIFEKGFPVEMQVVWSSGGGHMVILAGTDGRGRYYLHDPLNRVQHYQVLTYEGLQTYTPPYMFGQTGRPYGVVIPDIDECQCYSWSQSFELRAQQAAFAVRKYL